MIYDVRHTFLIFEQIDIFLSSAQTVSSSRDFGVEQFFEQMNFEQLTLLQILSLSYFLNDFFSSVLIMVYLRGLLYLGFRCNLFYPPKKSFELLVYI